MNVPYILVPDTLASKLERTLPPGYTFEDLPLEEGEPESFAVFAGSTQVAIVVVGERGFEFQYEQNCRQATWLKEEIEKLYFLNELRWLVVFPSHQSKWGYMGAPATGKEEALKHFGQMILKHGAMLIGFYLKDWVEVQNRLRYVHSFQLAAESPWVDDTDMGGAMIEFTNFEIK